MVVVRSGDGANVPDWSAESPSPSPPPASEITAVPPVFVAADVPAPSVAEPLPSEPLASEPFPLARDLESPPPSAPSAARPVVQAPAHAPERASSRRWLWKLLVPAALVSIAVAYVGVRGAPQPEKPEAKAVAGAARAEALVVAEPVAPAAPEAPPAEQPEAPRASAVAATERAEPPEPAARKRSPGGVTTKPVPPGATRVRLEVHPPDSKVGRRGVTQKPPYVYDVPKGKKVVLEVLRKGYTTRKVTLDGSSSRVVVGLARARSARGSR